MALEQILFEMVWESNMPPAAKGAMPLWKPFQGVLLLWLRGRTTFLRTLVEMGNLTIEMLRYCVTGKRAAKTFSHSPGPGTASPWRVRAEPGTIR